MKLEHPLQTLVFDRSLTAVVLFVLEQQKELMWEVSLTGLSAESLQLQCFYMSMGHLKKSLHYEHSNVFKTRLYFYRVMRYKST